jgi:tRNA U34 5-carboxymethylaminomethyl modifying enzyme MnmG/GidA
MNFDVIVVGGGHAGIEAACAAAKMGCSVGLANYGQESYGLECLVILLLEGLQKVTL